VADVVCLDAGVWIKVLVAEEGSEGAARLVTEVTVGGRVVAPAFCWAEVGSVLRKKVRGGEITVEESIDAWADFQAMPIDYVDEPAVRDRAWSLAERFGQATLYDAAYLAVTELLDGATREFWTADQALFDALLMDRPGYVHHLSEVSAAS
jgi:predicted nucleic acid-binding protein